MAYGPAHGWGYCGRMTLGEGWQLMKIRGIPLRIHPTWFAILLVVTLAAHSSYAAQFSSSVGTAAIWAASFLSALLLFVSVVLHELGHSLVALSQGVKVRSITLFLLGGVASVERECSTARGALMVAAAGPAVSLALGMSLLLISFTHGVSHLPPIFAAMVTRLGLLNLVLALFNLLPGLPLDGGLILKALVWQVTGNQRKGVEVANATGRFLSFLAVGVGTFNLLGGNTFGAWLILLGWFGLGAARNQGQMLKLQQALKDLKVRDVAQRRFRVLESSGTLRQLSQLGLDDLARTGAAAKGASDGAKTRGTLSEPPRTGSWSVIVVAGGESSMRALFRTCLSNTGTPKESLTTSVPSATSPPSANPLPCGRRYSSWKKPNPPDFWS
jgi:Zn-dependent protease